MEKKDEVKIDKLMKGCGYPALFFFVIPLCSYLFYTTDKISLFSFKEFREPSHSLFWQKIRLTFTSNQDRNSKLSQEYQMKNADQQIVKVSKAIAVGSTVLVQLKSGEILTVTRLGGEDYIFFVPEDEENQRLITIDSVQTILKLTATH